MILFYAEELSASRLNPKLEDHPLSAVRDCLLGIFAATLHMGGFSSICNLRKRHAVVTGTHLSWAVLHAASKCIRFHAVVFSKAEVLAFMAA
jgi:hypothetical protein